MTLHDRETDPPSVYPRRERNRITLFEIMAFVAGLAVAIWILVPTFRGDGPGEVEGVVLTLAFLLGGLSLVGPPLLIWERWSRSSRQRPFGPGRLMWFSQGMASWLLWPPVIYRRASMGNLERSTSAMCYAYGTPLMAVYMTFALVCGGWLRKRRRRAVMRSWRERFGLGLALVWACLGLYVLSIFYREDFRG